MKWISLQASNIQKLPNDLTIYVHLHVPIWLNANIWNNFQTSLATNLIYLVFQSWRICLMELGDAKPPTSFSEKLCEIITITSINWSNEESSQVLFVRLFKCIKTTNFNWPIKCS